MMMKDKRGDVPDIIVVLLILFFLVVSFSVVLLVNDKLYTIIATTQLNESTAAPAILNAFEGINSTTVQRGYMLFMGILFIGMIWSAFLTRTHPAFIFLYIIVLGFAVFMSVYLANIYDDLISTAVFTPIMADQSMMIFVWRNIVKITLVVGMLSMFIALANVFGRNESFGGADF